MNESLIKAMPTDSLCAQRLKVLADPVRLTILKILLAGPLHVKQINSHLQIEQSLLSHHLKTLRQENLVVTERDGKRILYHLAPGVNQDNGKAINIGCCVLSFGLLPKKL